MSKKNTPPSEDLNLDAAMAEESLKQPEEELNLNPLQIAYMQKLFATYEANLQFFQEQYPYIFQRLIEFEAEVPFSIDEQGDIIIHYRNSVGKPKDFVDLGKALYAYFDDPENRPRITTGVGYIDNEAIIAPQANMPYFFRALEPEYRIRLVRRFNELCPNPEDSDAISRFGDKALLIAVTFGVGYGWDIERIIDNYEIRHFIIIEPNARNLNLSLFFVDYIGLYHRFMARGGKCLTILTHDAKLLPPAKDKTTAENSDTAPLNEEASEVTDDITPLPVSAEPAKNTTSEQLNRDLAKDLRQAIRFAWPPYMARGAGLHFNDYRSDDVKEIWSTLGKEFFLLYMGWGFFDDEVLSLLHATQNLATNYPLCVYRTQNQPENSTAFVIGSGPSLDELFPLIEANKDKAIIISCGTALTALMRKGIKPDYHVEIERTDLTYEFLADQKHKEFVKDIPMLLIPAIPPEVFEMASQPRMLLKYVDSGSQLTDIDNSYPRFQTGPTVTNCGTDFCLRMGIKNVYLMGVDVGYPNEGLHHSAFSHYYDTEHSSDNLAQVVKQTDVACANRIPVPGNFGDEVFSTEIFIQARDLLASSIHQHRQSKVFNLNKGAAIRGAEPLYPADCIISATPADKQTALKNIESCFSTKYQSDPETNSANLCEQFDALIVDAHQILIRDYQSVLEVCDGIADFHQYLNAPKHEKTAVFPMLRGSMLHMCRIFFECLTMIRNREIALQYANEGVQTILAFLQAARELVADIPEEARRRMALRQDQTPSQNKSGTDIA